MKELNKELRLIQEQAIGVACIYGQDELVIKECEHTFTTISIGMLLGCSTTSYPKEIFGFKRFPNNKTLSEMMNSPLAFHDWCKENLKSKA